LLATATNLAKQLTSLGQRLLPNVREALPVVMGRFVTSDLSDIAVAEHRPIRQDGPTGTAN
jgi:hypothetical protein